MGKHTIEIEIDDTELWYGLSRLSSVSKMRVSEIVQRIANVLLRKYFSYLVKELADDAPHLVDYPEIKALM